MAGRCRNQYPLETMLRVHLMQNWSESRDVTMDEVLNEITPMWMFAGLTLTEPLLNETVIMNFRHVLRSNELAPEML